MCLKRAAGKAGQQSQRQPGRSASLPFPLLRLLSQFPSPLQAGVSKQQPVEAFPQQVMADGVYEASVFSSCPGQAQEPLGSDQGSQSTLCPGACQLQIVTKGSRLSSQMPEPPACHLGLRTCQM